MNPCLKGVHVGMKVEVVNCGMDVVDDSEVAFWVATVMQLRQHRVLLRYEGYEEDETADFWFDLRSPNIHPVGWCAKRNKLLIPPPGRVQFGSTLLCLMGCFFCSYVCLFISVCLILCFSFVCSFVWYLFV